jgi:hypothetical protein
MRGRVVPSIGKRQGIRAVAETLEINIDLDKLWEPAAVGLRRAYVFTGLGLNAAADDGLTNFHLPGLVKISFVPHEATPDQLREYKTEFGRWILGNGFRETIEAFAVSLDRVYEACLMTKMHTDRTPVSLTGLKTFHHAGIETKLARLKAEFGIEASGSVYLIALNKARNCLTHRRGVVGERDCDESGKLILRYKRFDLIFSERGRE